METKAYELSDWSRILTGGYPPTFFIELILRSAVCYIFLLVAMRIVGRRISSNVTRTEMAAMVSLAAAIGVPIFSPDRGLLVGGVVAIVVALIGAWLGRRSSDHPRFEQIVQGDITVLVKDGTLQLRTMLGSRISRERLFAQMRVKGITELGMVQRVYLEANGKFTVIKQEKPVPGLLILPTWDKEFISRQKADPEHRFCAHCGAPAPTAGAQGAGKCPNCEANEWTQGYISES